MYRIIKWENKHKNVWLIIWKELDKNCAGMDGTKRSVNGKLTAFSGVCKRAARSDERIIRREENLITLRARFSPASAGNFETLHKQFNL